MCGTNGITYKNLCYAECNETGVRYAGACSESNLPCDCPNTSSPVYDLFGQEY